MRTQPRAPHQMYIGLRDCAVKDANTYRLIPADADAKASEADGPGLENLGFQKCLRFQVLKYCTNYSGQKITTQKYLNLGHH